MTENGAPFRRVTLLGAPLPAARSWAAAWRLWGPPLVVGVLVELAVATFSNAAAGWVMLALIMLAGWVGVAIALGRLTNATLTPGRVARRCMMTVVAIAAVAVATAMAWLIVTFLGVLALLVASGGAKVSIETVWWVEGPVTALVLFYALARATFVAWAVFDGAGPIEAIRVSWRLGQRSLWRNFAWMVAITVPWLLIGGFGTWALRDAGVLGALRVGAVASLTFGWQIYGAFVIGQLYLDRLGQRGSLAATPAQAAISNPAKAGLMARYEAYLVTRTAARLGQEQAEREAPARARLNLAMMIWMIPLLGGIWSQQAHEPGIGLVIYLVAAIWALVVWRAWLRFRATKNR